MIRDAILPATLSAHPSTDEECAGFCTEHPNLTFEIIAKDEHSFSRGLMDTGKTESMQNLSAMDQLKVYPRDFPRMEPIYPKQPAIHADEKANYHGS